MKIFARIFLLLLMTIVVCLSDAFAQGVRPVKDNVGFCWNPAQMKKLIGYLQKHEWKKISGENLVAGISPHDDYLYAAKVYLPLYQAIRAKEVVIFGVTHMTVRKEIGDPKNILILDHYNEWTGLRHDVQISPLREYIKRNLDASYFDVNDKAQRLEHSVEALIPFLQYYNPDVKIIPIMVTAMPFGRMDTISDQLSNVIAKYIRENKLVVGRDIFFLISSDANHYGKDFDNAPFGEDLKAHEEGTTQDVRIADKCLAGEMTGKKVESLTDEMKRVVWCGRFSIPFGLLTIEKTIRKSLHKDVYGKLILYSDSFSEGVIPLKGTEMGTTAPFSLKHWVGWLSAGYYLK